MRISNSFSEGEVQVLDFILQTVLRGGSPTVAARNRDFASLCRKVMAMKARMVESQRPVGAQSSVGQIAAIDAGEQALEAKDTGLKKVG